MTVNGFLILNQYFRSNGHLEGYFWDVPLLMDIWKAGIFHRIVEGRIRCCNIAVLAKRSRALLESNPARNSQRPISQ